ncbi:hypothetical protein ACQP1W_38835 [Spirillospora sp. CA-255316]
MSDDHYPGHGGVGLDCPIGCLGLNTVGDLLHSLTAAVGVAGLVGLADRAGPEHHHERVGPGCPLACLGLPTRTRLSLERRDPDPVRTVGALLALLRTGGIDDVRHIGPVAVHGIWGALQAAGLASLVQPGGAAGGSSGGL